MRSLRNVCLLCRNLTPPNPPTFVPKRNAYFSKYEPYILPRLVIDLDDADSKYVRRAEELEDEEPELDPQSFQSRPQSATLKEKHLSERGAKSKSPHPSLVKVTPPDLLAYALMGDPDKRKPTSYRRISKRLGHIYASHSIHPSESVETKIQILTQNTLQNTEAHFSLDNFDETKRPAILSYLENCRGLDPIQQIVSLLCLTNHGCQLLTDHIASLAEGLRSCQKTKYPDVVIFLNNLIHNLNSKGVQVGSPLCNLGLYYACSTHNIPATKFYLDILDHNEYTLDRNTRRALSALFRALDSIKRGETYSPSSQFNIDGALNILAGPQVADNHSVENQAPSFASLSRRDMERHIQRSLYASYILYLGELGLADHLQSEWESTGESKSLSSGHKADVYTKQRGNNVSIARPGNQGFTSSNRIPTVLRRLKTTKPLLFGIAFLLAKQPGRALNVLKDLETSTFRMPEDFLPTLIGMIYKMHNVEPSKKLSSLIQRNLSATPDAAEDTLALLEFFLMTDTPRFEQFDGGAHLEVDCAEYDGGACLFVMPRRGSKALYFKSSSLRPGILKFD